MHAPPALSFRYNYPIPHLTPHTIIPPIVPPGKRIYRREGNTSLKPLYDSSAAGRSAVVGDDRDDSRKNVIHLFIN